MNMCMSPPCLAEFISFSSNSTHPGVSKPSFPTLHLKLLVFHLRPYSLSTEQSYSISLFLSSACHEPIPLWLSFPQQSSSHYLVPTPFLGLQLLSTCPPSFLEHLLHLPAPVPLSLPSSLSSGLPSKSKCTTSNLPFSLCRRSPAPRLPTLPTC